MCLCMIKAVLKQKNSKHSCSSYSYMQEAHTSMMISVVVRLIVAGWNITEMSLLNYSVQKMQPTDWARLFPLWPPAIPLLSNLIEAVRLQPSHTGCTDRETQTHLHQITTYLIGTVSWSSATTAKKWICLSVWLSPRKYLWTHCCRLRHRGSRVRQSCQAVKWTGSLWLSCTYQRGRVHQGKSSFLTHFSLQGCQRWNWPCVWPAGASQTHTELHLCHQSGKKINKATHNTCSVLIISCTPPKKTQMHTCS